GGQAGSRGDRADELVEVVERPGHEEVGPAPVEPGRLLGEELLAEARRGRLADRPDRAGDEDVAAGRLPRLPGELDRRAVDRLELVVEVVRRELAAVRPAGGRLDQLGAAVA